MSTGSISTYRNKKRACCQSRTASSILYTISTPKWRGDVDISVTLLKQTYGIHQRLTGHMHIALQGCRFVPKAAEEHWATGSVCCAGMTEIMEPHIPKIPCNPISEILQFSYFCYPRYLYTSSNFSPLREAKNGENRPEKLQLSQRFLKPRCRR